MIVSNSKFVLVFSAFICSVCSGARQRSRQKSSSIRMEPSPEQVLVRDLIRQYSEVGRDVRPVKSANQTLQIRVGVQLQRIIELDTRNQILTAVIKERFTWRDRLLQWDPRAFGGINHVRLPADKIWTPDIVLINIAEEVVRPNADREVAVVDNHGHVLYIRSSIVKSICVIDAQHFPFDNQSCHLQFASFTYDGFKLDMEFFDEHHSVDLTEYIPSQEWSVTHQAGRKAIKYYPCCVEPFPEVVFTIPMRRASFFYRLTLVGPGLLLCILTAVTFYIPVGTSDKANIGMTVFLCLLVLMLITIQVLPTGGSVYSHFGMLLYQNMFAIFASIISTTVFLNLYAKGKKGTSVPKLIRLIFVEVLARVMCIRCTFSKCSKKRTQKDHISNDTLPLMPDDTYHHRDNNHMHDPRVVYYLRCVDASVQQLVKCSNEMVDCLRHQDKISSCASDWFVVAQVVDRLLFLVYIAFIISTLINFFL